MNKYEERFFKSVAKGFRASEIQTNDALRLFDYSEDFLQECLRVFQAVGCTLQEPTERTCKKCQETKPRQQFRRYGERYSTWCRECVKERDREKNARRSSGEGRGRNKDASLHQCEGPECDRQAVTKTPIGYCCHAHRVHYKNYGEFRVLRKIGSKRQVSETHRLCKTCDKVKPNEEFYFSKRGSKGYYSSDCKKCMILNNSYQRKEKIEPKTHDGSLTEFVHEDSTGLVGEYLTSLE